MTVLNLDYYKKYNDKRLLIMVLLVVLIIFALIYLKLII